jgi:hypothetical protein
LKIPIIHHNFCAAAVTCFERPSKITDAGHVERSGARDGVGENIRVIAVAAAPVAVLNVPVRACISNALTQYAGIALVCVEAR